MITDKTNQQENKRQDLQDYAGHQETETELELLEQKCRKTDIRIQEYSESRDKQTHIPKDELATNHRQVWTINTLGNATLYAEFFDVRRS